MERQDLAGGGLDVTERRKATPLRGRQGMRANQRHKTDRHVEPEASVCTLPAS